MSLAIFCPWAFDLDLMSAGEKSLLKWTRSLHFLPAVAVAAQRLEWPDQEERGKIVPPACRQEAARLYIGIGIGAAGLILAQGM